MPEVPNAASGVPSLSERLEVLRQDICSLLSKGLELDRFEFKREMQVNGPKRLQFVKVMQGMANAHLSESRYLVVGADASSKTFVKVENAKEFDAANVASVLAKYLYPIPSFEVFALQSDDGEDFIVLHLLPQQPKPIVLKAESSSDDGKLTVRVGEIWLRKNTKLETATREDLDLMYKERADAEGELLARRRFAHFQDAGLAVPPTATQKTLPTNQLILGPKSQFRDFVSEVLWSNDEPRFRMSLEVIRDLLVEGWDTPPQLAGGQLDRDRRKAYLEESFVPAVDALIEVGLLVIKNDHNSRFLDLIMDLCLEGFENCRERVVFLREDPSAATPEWRAPLLLHVGARCLATYALKRERERFLPSILRHVVRPIVPPHMDEGLHVPFCFWPFGFGLAVDGVTQLCWEERVKVGWPEYFNSWQNYVQSAAKLEFVLELNSWLAIGTFDKGIKVRFDEKYPQSAFGYVPDIWRLDLKDAAPLARRLLRSLADGTEPALWKYISMSSEAIDMAFFAKKGSDRLAVLGTFLAHLQDFRGQIMMQRNRFPGFFAWPDELDGIVKEVREKAKAKTQGSIT